MAQWILIASAVAAIFTVVLIGAVIRRLNWLTHEADQALIAIVVRVLVPALIVDVIVGEPAVQQADNILLPPVVGFASIALGVGAALAVGRWLGPVLGMRDPRQRRTFAMCIGLYNYGYLPLPLAERLFDKGTVGVLFVHNLGVELAMWTLVLMALEGSVGRGWYKRLINAPLVAIVVSLLINATGVDRAQLPGFALTAVHMLGVCAIPLALLLIGATIADHLAEAKLHTGMRVIGAACALRLGVLPVLFLLAAAMIPATVELKRVMVLQAAMPSAVFPIILARHYGGDASTAIRVVLGTTVVSLVTMPLWVSWGLVWVGQGG